MIIRHFWSKFNKEKKKKIVVNDVIILNKNQYQNENEKQKIINNDNETKQHIMNTVNNNNKNNINNKNTLKINNNFINHNKRPSVEFEDIYNIENGNKLPIYISNDDESESSTFTASSRHTEQDKLDNN